MCTNVTLFFFFFSSRRRHTRFDCDWSSDVCSSDLIDLASARTAAAICAMRALAFVQRAAGSLDAVRAVARITVYVRSAPDFTQQSEVADGASDLIALLGEIEIGRAHV